MVLSMNTPNTPTPTASLHTQTAIPPSPDIRVVYAVLSVGFLLLLSLIGAVTWLSTSRMREISFKARDFSQDYRLRLTLALQLREETGTLIAQAKLVRATRHRPIPIIPFITGFNASDKEFRRLLNDARKEWKKRAESKSLPIEELAAWNAVEAAAEKFLVSVLTAVNEDPQTNETNATATPNNATNPPSTGAEQQAPPPSVGDDTIQERFRLLRGEIDRATQTLVDTIITSQTSNLEKAAQQQTESAANIQRIGSFAFLLGFCFAVAAFLVARRQITRLRQASQGIREAYEFAQSVFDSQANDILVFNENGERLAVNQAFYKHFNLTRADLILHDYRGTLAHLPEIANFVGKTLHKAPPNGSQRERIPVIPRHATANGEARLFDVKVSPLTVGRQTRGRVVVMEDITDAEREREEMRRNRTLSAVGQITAQVAHELYNPIGAVKLNIELLEMQTGGDEDVKHTVARLKRGAEHLSTIVMDLRYLTRPRDPERKPTDLNVLLDEVIELAGDRLERSRVHVNRAYAANLPRGEFDPQQLRKVFLNLLINAIEASTPNSEVSLLTQYIPNQGEELFAEFPSARAVLAVRVEDRGTGMSEETKRRLFEAFYTTKRNGTGLGMMITLEILKKHNGKIEIESTEGVGTTVSVYLPVSGK